MYEATVSYPRATSANFPAKITPSNKKKKVNKHPYLD